MKKTLFLFCLLVFTGGLNAQIIIGKDAKQRKLYQENRETQEQNGYDITPFPGEYPQQIMSAASLGASEIHNWGELLILPPAIADRMAVECTHNVVVKVFDTAGKISHASLENGQLPGSNYAGGPLEDENGHSSHVSGIIVGDGFGVLDRLATAGLVHWKPVKVLTAGGSGQFSWIANAIASEDVENKQLLESGTFVVCTMSLGGGTAKQTPVESALKASTEAGVIYTVATGNTGQPGVNYPGNSMYVVGVGSLDNANPLVHSSYTSTGPELWVGMPGRSIQSCYLNNSYATLSGTSMATPFAASAVAVALSKWGNDYLFTPEQVKSYLAWCASDLEVQGKDNNTGWGVEMIKAILDRNPADTPGSPGDPTDPDPEDPDPTDPPTHSARNLNFSLIGAWPIYWNNDLGLSYSQTAGQPLMPINKPRKLKAAGFDRLTITRLEIQIPESTDLSGVAFSNLTNGVDRFFTNRGLMLAGGSDYADAAYWSAYFLELILDKQTDPALSVNVERIEAKDKNGKTVTILGSDLKHWPIGSELAGLSVASPLNFTLEVGALGRSVTTGKMYKCTEVSTFLDPTARRIYKMSQTSKPAKGDPPGPVWILEKDFQTYFTPYLSK